MKEISELIDAWLDDALPETERRQVEQRMATDEDFRREVELQRALRKTLGDPGRLRLFSSLEAAMQEPLPDNELSPISLQRPVEKNHWKWWFAVPVTLLFGVGIWYFTKPSVPYPSPTLPPVEAPVPPPAENQPLMPPTKNDTSIQSQPTAPEQKHQNPTPIAQVDSASFNENPTMEALMGVRGNGDLTVELTSPQNSAVFQPDNEGKTNLRFSGKLTGTAPNEAVALDLLIFNNKSSHQPLLALPLQPTANTAAKAGFDLRQSVKIPKGLYYFRLEERESGELLVVGKFFIGSM